MSSTRELTDWMFRALMFEAEAEPFRSAGIRIGADLRDAEASLLEEVLSPYSVSLRNNALRMTRLYAMLHCFENSVRELIQDRLSEKHGADWWEKIAPRKIQEMVASRVKKAQDNTWLDAGHSPAICFADFGDLAAIILNSWDDFSDLIPTQHWLKQRMEELEQARNSIAHHRILLPAEFLRLELYLADWNRQVGI